MRPVVGAGMLVVVLGSGHLVCWLADMRSSPPAGPPALAVVTEPAPRQAPAIPAASSPTPCPRRYYADPLVFLSTAPPESLELLPGIGPVLAARIAADRVACGPFETWTELDRVRGIGPATIDRLQKAARRP